MLFAPFSLALMIGVWTSVIAWDPDAGIVESWTKMAGVTVSATSSISDVNRVIDDDDNTNWVSSNSLPQRYISRAECNIFLGLCGTGQGACAGTTVGDMSKLTDGATNTLISAPVSHTDGKARVSIMLPSAKIIQWMTVWGIYSADAAIFGVDSTGIAHHLRDVRTSDNYRDIAVTNIKFKLKSVFVESTSHFSIKEISAIGANGCSESITVNLGSIRKVTSIRTRHWAGTHNAVSLQLLTSQDGHTWTSVTFLDPDALHAVYSRVDPPQNIQYISLKYSVTLEKYRKVFCYEIDAWDENSKWGTRPPVVPQQNSLRQILGVNGIWGWGHKKYSNQLQASEGPRLYNTIASNARNYHNLNWDVLEPDNDPGFENMAKGQGTNGQWWLNWDTEYTAWDNANMTVDASIQMRSFRQSRWKFPEQSAFHYGKEFAKHFGPQHGNGLISAMEVGNEPWDYDASFYKLILKGMSAGARSVDTKIKVLPGAFQAHDKHDKGNYIGTRVEQDVAHNISAINFHTYSYRNNVKGVRTGTYPEHPDSTFNSVNNIVRWRDTNTPGKSIWVTEWGWDSPGSGENCTFPECVTEKGQALYAVRGLLILARANVEKAHWFFYADSDDCSTHLYCRSGLTTSNVFQFAKKKSFLAFEALLNKLGDTHFLSTIQEDENAYIYSFGNRYSRTLNGHQSLSVASHLVTWRPVASEDSTTRTVSITLPPGTKIGQQWRITGSSPMTVTSTSASQVNDVMTITVSTEPVIVQLHHTIHGPVVG